MSPCKPNSNRSIFRKIYFLILSGRDSKSRCALKPYSIRRRRSFIRACGYVMMNGRSRFAIGCTRNGAGFERNASKAFPHFGLRASGRNGANNSVEYETQTQDRCRRSYDGRCTGRTHRAKDNKSRRSSQSTRLRCRPWWTRPPGNFLYPAPWFFCAHPRASSASAMAPRH